MYLSLIIKKMQAHVRAVETARSISKITVDFFSTLDMHASNVTQIVDEAKCVNDQKLSELEKKFEVCLRLHNDKVEILHARSKYPILISLLIHRIVPLLKNDSCWKR